MTVDPGSRRTLVRAAGAIAANAALARPLCAGAATAPPRAFSAADFGNGARRGFVLGGVERDPALLDAMATFGANTARVFFPFARCRGCAQFGRAANAQAAMQALLDRAASLQMKLVVVGSFDVGELPAFWTDAGLRASVVENWGWFAATFGRHPALAGIDLLNEPNPPAPAGDLATSQDLWRTLAERAIAAIRSTGVDVPIVFEPVRGASTEGLVGMRPLADRNVVYSIHFYAPHDITHQGVGPAWSRRIPYPAGREWGLGTWDAKFGITAWDHARLRSALADAREFQLTHRVPIYVGEFSCVRSAPDGSSTRWVSDCLDLFDGFGWSWTYHEFRGWPGWDAEIAAADLALDVRTRDAPTITALRRSMAALDPALPSRASAR